MATTMGEIQVDARIKTSSFKKDASEIEKISQKVSDSSTKSFEDSSTRVQNSFKTLLKVGTVAVVGVSAALFSFVKDAANVEMLRTSMDTLTGSTKAGGEMYKKLAKMAKETPFDTTDLAESTATLLAYNVAQEEILPNLKMLGDISLGNKAKLGSLALAFGQIQSKGKLAGQEMLQLTNIGFNPLQVISQKTGRSMDDLNDAMARGEISVEMVKEAMISATSEGGRFYKGMDKGSKTLTGTWSTLQDNMGVLTRKLVGLSDTGEIVQGSLIDKVAIGVRELTYWIENNGATIDMWATDFQKFVGEAWDFMKGFSSWIKDNKDWLGPLIIGIGLFKVALDIASAINAAIGLIVGLQTLVASPMIMPAIVIAAAILAIVKVIEAYTQMKNAIDGAKTAEQNLFDTRMSLLKRSSEVASSSVYSPEVKARWAALAASTNRELQSSFATNTPVSMGSPLTSNLQSRFSSGGFTGQGGMNEPAGIVHRGEFVLPQSMVNQSTGLPKSEMMQSGSTININVSGAIVSSPQDQRKFAEVIAKRMNEVMQQKGLQPLKGF